MNCPHCPCNKSHIFKQARLSKGVLIKRLRTCAECGKDFETIEMMKTTVNRLHELLRARRDLDHQITTLIGAVKLSVSAGEQQETPIWPLTSTTLSVVR